MRITHHDLSGTGAAGAGQTYGAQGAGSTQGAGGVQNASSADSDRVDFSSSLGSLSRAMSADGQNRSARLEALTTLFRSGGYQADSAAISRGLVSDAMGE